MRWGQHAVSLRREVCTYAAEQKKMKTESLSCFHNRIHGVYDCLFSSCVCIANGDLEHLCAIYSRSVAFRPCVGGVDVLEAHYARFCFGLHVVSAALFLSE